ncbi:MAG: hypothetical protein ACYS8Z_06320 [Planctomycetota bacterium]
MRTIHMKEWWHKISPHHSLSWEMRHMIHDKTFWLVVALICFAVLMGVLIAFGVWSSGTGGTVSEDFYRYTF